MPPRTLLAAIAMALLATAGPARAADRDEARTRLDQARAHLLRGEFKDCLRMANESIGADDRLGPAYELRARLWNILGDPTRQKQDAQRALELASRSSGPEELETLGGAQLLLGQIDKALVTLDSAVQSTKRSPDSLAARARAWRQMGENAKAVSDLDEALLAEPRTALWLYARARSRYDMSNDALTVADLTKALRINKSFPIAYALLGAALSRQGDFTRALKAYDRALALDPEYSFAFLGKAAIHLRLGEEASALKEFKDAILADPQDYAPYFNRAEMHWRAGRPDQAKEDFRKALESSKLAGDAALAIGDRYMSLQLWTDAIDAYTKARSLDRAVPALLRSAKAWEILEEPKKALKNLDEAVSLEEKSAQIVAARGSLEARMGLDKNALDDLTRAVRLAPEDAGILTARAGFFASRGKPQLALADYDRAIGFDSKHAAAYNGRGALRANSSNEIDKAMLDVSKAVELKPREPGFHFNLGSLQMRAGLYLRAIDSFDTALALKGPAARILERRAEARSMRGDHVAAHQDIGLSLEKDAKSASAYSTLGAIRLRSRQYEQSVRDFSQALRLDDAAASVLMRRAQAYGALGRLDAALADLRRSSQLDASSKETWTDLCKTRRLMKDPKAALKDCDKAIALDPQHGPAYFQRALARYALKQHARVIEDVDTASQFGVRRAEGLIAKAVAHAAERQYKEAHRVYIQAVSLDPSARSAYDGFAAGHPEGDDFLSAIVDLDARMQEDRRDPYVFILRADALSNAEQFDKAVLEYTKAMELDGTLADAYTGRGTALNAQDAPEAAQQDFMRAIELAPDDASARIRLAVTLTMRKDFKTALAELDKALKLDPVNSEAYLRAGNVRYFLKDYPRALDNYALAVKHDPHSANALNGQGLGYFALKRNDDALESFSRAIALDPRTDRYFRNRAVVWASMKKYGNAAGDFRTASMVNTDPAAVDEYRKLIEDADSRSAHGQAP